MDQMTKAIEALLQDTAAESDWNGLRSICQVLRPWANVEHRIGDRVVNAEEFERSCIEDEEKKKAELKRHMHESANAIMHYINKEGGMRKVQDICGTPFGSLVAYVLDGEAL